MIKLSVIIPVYNVAPYIGECLDSLICAASHAEDLALIDLICIDDGSTDSSGDILDQYARHTTNPNITFTIEHRENGGVSSARNRGLDIASGDYFLFVDSDDFVRETYFADVCRIISENPGSDLISFGMLPFYGGDIEWHDNERQATQKIVLDTAIDEHVSNNSICTFCYKRELANGLRFKSYSHGEDLVFMANIFSKAKTCIISSKNEYVYRFREGSATHKDFSPTHMVSVVGAFAELFAILSKSGKTPGNGYKINLASMWLNEQPRFILKRITQPGWEKTWEAWLDSMKVASQIAFFSNGSDLPLTRRTLHARACS